MKSTLPEKARVLKRLRDGKFNVPDFIYLSASDFENEDFEALVEFLRKHQESYKVITRSAHPQEEFFKGGTFDSLNTYADLSGIKYARNRMIRLAGTTKRLTILRQQRFSNAPELNLHEMGVIVMPFIYGTNIMAKMLGDHWEFGYCRDRIHKIVSEPYITYTPHDTKLLQISKDIQEYLGFRCEIEYINSEDGEIHVVQAKDISTVDTMELKENERAIKLDGLRRIRKRRNYRERPIFLMDNQAFYMEIIGQCENLVHGWKKPKPGIEDVLEIITSYDAEMKNFALRHQRFGIIGLSIQAPDELYQIANHYLEDMPEFQNNLSKALLENRYKIDYFLSEADTLIAKEKLRINLCSHDAYGIDTVRNPMWSVYWAVDRHDEIVNKFHKIGFKTGDMVGIDIDSDEKPTVQQL